MHDGGWGIPRGRITAKGIRELVDGDHVCRAIVQYFVRHSDAADTMRGIAEWWIKSEVSQTASALTKLPDYGVVPSHVIQEATSVYMLTKSRLAREALRRYVEESRSAVALERR